MKPIFMATTSVLLRLSTKMSRLYLNMLYLFSSTLKTLLRTCTLFLLPCKPYIYKGTLKNTDMIEETENALENAESATNQTFFSLLAFYLIRISKVIFWQMNCETIWNQLFDISFGSVLYFSVRWLISITLYFGQTLQI